MRQKSTFYLNFFNFKVQESSIIHDRAPLWSREWAWRRCRGRQVRVLFWSGPWPGPLYRKTCTFIQVNSKTIKQLKFPKVYLINCDAYWSKLPVWMQSFIPNMFYIEEKSWNYYPFTITEYTVSISGLSRTQTSFIIFI